ncbi:hypothetical protein RB195_003089 [Necator americanus]|uniref:Uncharacterized protein n=1 Tax=Necator americanus TaxID=51031 RepID=A0ABR1DM11_NECAM
MNLRITSETESVLERPVYKFCSKYYRVGLTGQLLFVTNSKASYLSIANQLGIRHFPIIEPEVVRVELGDPYSRNCTPPVSNPTARVYWILKGDEGTAVTFESINSSHISSNEQEGSEIYEVADNRGLSVSRDKMHPMSKTGHYWEWL